MLQLPHRIALLTGKASHASMLLAQRGVSNALSLAHRTTCTARSLFATSLRCTQVRKLKTPLKGNQSGFAMPTIIFLIVIMSLVAYAALLQSNNNLKLVYKQAYLQMARVASKAAVDYAQEQFDNTVCGDYSGTAEQDLVSTDTYRITMKAEVIETSADGYEKTIRGTGSIYLPKTSQTAQYVFDIRAEIVRTYALCKSPDNFAPLVWLDASDTNTLKKTSIPTTTTSSTVGLGALDLLLPNDTVEEKVSDGSQGILSWLSGDIEMHTCDVLEYTVASCTGSMTSKDLYTGIVFQNVNIPKDASITSATLRFHGATPSGVNGSLTHRVYGLYQTSSNPHLQLFQPLESNQVRNRITNSSLRTSSYIEYTSNNFPPGNNVDFNVTSVVQQMVNNTNWNPSSNGGRIGFGVQRQSGSGERKACKGNPGTGACANNGPELIVTYTNGSVPTQANNGEGIDEWQDKSGNGNHARYTYGNKPTRQDNQINSKPIVRFNNGALLSSLMSTLSNKREMTVFAVMKPNFSSSSSDGRIISGMSTAGSNDTTAGNSIVPLLRNASNNGFSSIYAGSSTSNRTNFNCTGCANTPYMAVSSFTISGSNAVTAAIKGNGQPGTTKTGISQSASPPPYIYSINQLYFGGRRNGSGAGSGTNYFNGDYAELVVYDYALTCRQIEAIEEYLRNKWNLYGTPAATTCPADTIPVL